MARVAVQKKGPDVFVKSGALGSDDVDPAQQRIEISTSGPATFDKSDIEAVDPARMRSLAEDEKFMNELVEIEVEAGDDPNEPLFVHSGHNGDPQYIQRGVPQTIKRRFLYSLIAAKTAQLVCSFGKGQDGKEFNRLAGPKKGTHRVTLRRDSERGRDAFNLWTRMA